MTEFLQGLEA